MREKLFKTVRRRCAGQCRRDLGLPAAAAGSWRRSGAALMCWSAAAAGTRWAPAHLRQVLDWPTAARCHRT